MSVLNCSMASVANEYQLQIIFKHILNEKLNLNCHELLLIKMFYYACYYLKDVTNNPIRVVRCIL